ncbi:type IV pilus modification PilV family protein [Bhargavaea cecembensis]|uniref:type IV pilus modification PilV family protein n=1 Tax=Bhargavaea cecembensis TaxID=394098 RepID=UPI000590469D|nr:prepilin-type N-terminal cleavage/methylation domain-containing protein [Bhargavaea cecembensis]
MNSKGAGKWQSGLTLIEVLAAVVLLGIVFLLTASIFPQMTKMNTATGKKMDTMTLARNQLADIEGVSLRLASPTLDSVFNQLNDQLTEKFKKTSVTGEYERTGADWKYKLTISPEPSYKGSKAEPPLSGTPALYQVKLEVSENGKSASSVYGYLEVELSEG